MRHVLRHLPLLVLTAILLVGAVSCGDNEPSGKHHDPHGDSPTPVDTTHHNDTTGNDTTATDTTHHTGGNDTVPPVTITIAAPRDYGYMGQTLQLDAVTTSPETVTWRSTHTTVATIDNNGLLNFSNIINDDSTLIIATASGISDTLSVTNRCWTVAAWNGTAWTQSTYNVHPGDTISFTIVDSQTQLIDDNGFNAAAVQWTAMSFNADVTALITSLDTPGQANGWKRRWIVTPDATTGAIITIMAQLDDAASTITCPITR